jgi:undecaprenyl diphosphate synthase
MAADSPITAALSTYNHVPLHVAIIMDGNGRWAIQKGLTRLKGHQAGANNVSRVVKRLHDRGVRYITLYAFSTENWERPSYEIRGLLTILKKAIRKETDKLNSHNVCLRHLGRTDRLPRYIQREIHRAQEITRNNSGVTLCIAFDYGGRAEILEATRQIVRDRIPIEEINEDLIQKYLYTTGIPNPDLIIRTSGEQRLSNFLLWQSAYSEYYSTKAAWPDFDEQEIDKALGVYQQRDRRYGGLMTAT